MDFNLFPDFGRLPLNPGIQGEQLPLLHLNAGIFKGSNRGEFADQRGIGPISQAQISGCRGASSSRPELECHSTH
jgi:hypothetical protein